MPPEHRHVLLITVDERRNHSPPIPGVGSPIRAQHAAEPLASTNKAGATTARSGASTGGHTPSSSGGGTSTWGGALMAGTAIGAGGLSGAIGFGGSGAGAAGGAAGAGLGQMLAGLLGAGPGSVSVAMPSSAAKGSGAATGGAGGAKAQTRGGVGGETIRLAEYTSAPRVEVYVGYTQVPNPVACNPVYCNHHAFVALRDPGTGRNLATRAGPGGKGVPGEWGTIRTQTWPWEHERFRDRPEETVHLQYVGQADMSLAEAKQVIAQLEHRVQAAAIPYDPLGPNSNSYAKEVLRELGMGLVDPELSTPGWYTQLFSNQAPQLPQPTPLHPIQGTPLQI